jgi:ABC-type multidrug transport system fused ATPase/permease subunit
MMRMLGADRPLALATYGLLTIEEGVTLALPALMGFAVDRLIAVRSDGLAYLIGAVLAILAFGALRRFVDTRLYVRVQQRLSLHHLEQSAEVPAGIRAGHIRLVGDLTQFFELHVPQGISAVFASFGALAALALYDPRVALLAAGCAALLLGINAIYAAKTTKLNERINGRLEKEVGVVSTARRLDLIRHFHVLGKLRVARSDAETATYGVYWLLFLGLISAVLLLIADTGASPGTVFAQMSYILGFAESWNHWPMLVERYTQMRDVANRLKLGAQ